MAIDGVLSELLDAPAAHPEIAARRQETRERVERAVEVRRARHAGWWHGFAVGCAAGALLVVALREVWR